jgi:hypothetical protein
VKLSLSDEAHSAGSSLGLLSDPAADHSELHSYVPSARYLQTPLAALPPLKKNDQ